MSWAIACGAALVTVGVTAGRRRERERLLRQSESRFRAVVENSSDSVTVVDREGAVIYQSPSIERVLGHSVESVQESGLEAFVHAQDIGQLKAAVTDAPAAGAVGALEFRVAHADGGWREMEAVVTNLLDEPAVKGVVISARDATERRAREAELRHTAFRDPLTGLANRVLFQDRLKLALSRVRRSRRPAAVMFIDLDDFKAINDSMGHAQGDMVLTAVAGRLQSRLRGSDTLARLGGDEFAVLSEELTDDDDALRLADDLLEVLGPPFHFPGHTLVARASIGLALAHTGLEDPVALLRDADNAMYTVKAEAKGGRALFEKEDAPQP